MLCDIPPQAPFRSSDGCAIVRPGGHLNLPKDVTEVDIWTRGGKRLRQFNDTYPDSATCPQWGFYSPGQSALAGWVTCNHDVFVWGRRTVKVFWWRG